MQGLIDFSGTLSGAISGEGGGGDVPVITATATVDNNTGVPECNVTRTGSDTNPNFNFAFKNIKGATGATGANGQNGSDGVDGISPTIDIESITGGTRVTIADAEHPSGQTFDVMNGLNGQNGSDGINGTNGISPTVSISTLSDPSGHAVTITDATHPSGQTFNVMDGERGAQGIQGIQGEKGDTGAGLPIGGNIGQIIQKSTIDNFATEWVNNSAGIQSFDDTNCEIISHNTTQLALEDLDAECFSINASLTQKVGNTPTLLLYDTVTNAYSESSPKNISLLNGKKLSDYKWLVFRMDTGGQYNTYSASHCLPTTLFVTDTVLVFNYPTSGTPVQVRCRYNNDTSVDAWGNDSSNRVLAIYGVN